VERKYLLRRRTMWTPLSRFIKLTEDGFYLDFSETEDEMEEPEVYNISDFFNE